MAWPSKVCCDIVKCAPLRITESFLLTKAQAHPCISPSGNLKRQTHYMPYS